MSAEYKGQNPLDIAAQAERDLNSHAAKHGHDADRSANHGKGASDSSKIPSLHCSIPAFPYRTLLRLSPLPLGEHRYPK